MLHHVSKHNEEVESSRAEFIRRKRLKINCRRCEIWKKPCKEHNEHQRAVHRNTRGPMGGLRKNHNPLTPQGPSEEEEDEDKETHGLLEGLRTKLRPLTPHEPLEEDEKASEEEMERRGSPVAPTRLVYLSSWVRD